MIFVVSGPKDWGHIAQGLRGAVSCNFKISGMKDCGHLAQGLRGAAFVIFYRF